MKLIKTTDEQGVMYSLSGEELPENYVLSIKNCQAIANGYDLDELAEKANGYLYFDSKKEHKALAFNEGYHIGFKKALEILGEKKFSEKDLDDFRKFQIREQNFSKSCLDVWLKSLQQNEWDVEMEKVKDETKIIGAVKGVKGSGDKITTYKSVPKLDADGCLILKKI